MAHLFRRFGPSVWQVRSKKAAFKGRKIGDQMDRRKIIKAIERLTWEAGMRRSVLMGNNFVL